MITPTIALDWTSGTAQSGVDVARAGVATFVGSNGFIQSASANTQRVDWSTGTPGLLIEETRTNRFLNSNNFAAIWTVNNLDRTANAIQSPDGGMNGWKITPTTTNASHTLGQTHTLTATPHTWGFFAKQGGYTILRVANLSTGGSVRIDLSNGNVLASAAGYTATVKSAGDGWYRCQVTFTPSAGSLVCGFYIEESLGVAVFAGDGVKSIYLYQGQLEAGSFSTSPIPTEASQVTRNADVATITGSNFTSFWSATQGGATVHATPSTVSGVRPLVQFDDGTANEIIALRGNVADPELYIVDGGTPQAQLDAGTIAANTAYSLTGWWATNDCKARKDAGAVVTDTTATIPTVTQMRIGSDGTNYLNGTIATINYYASFSSQIYTRRKNKVVFQLF